LDEGKGITFVCGKLVKAQEMVFKEAEVSKKPVAGENEPAKLVVPEMSQMTKVELVVVAEAPPALVTVTLQV